MTIAELTPIIVAVLGAGGLGAFVTYLIARRRTSGEVRTTDADRLWMQYDKLLDGYAKDNNLLRERVQHAENRLYEKINVVETKVNVVEGKVDIVSDDIRTGNKLTVGQMLSDAETRRLVQKQEDHESLTQDETQHLVDVPPKNGGESL